MSGCAHMNPEDWCASCIPEKYAALREEIARLRAERDAALVHGPEDLIRALEESNAEVKRLEGLILDWWDNYDNYAPSAALEAEAKRIRGEKRRSAPAVDSPSSRWGRRTTDSASAAGTRYRCREPAGTTGG